LRLWSQFAAIKGFTRGDNFAQLVFSAALLFRFLFIFLGRELHFVCVLDSSHTTVLRVGNELSFNSCGAELLESLADVCVILGT